MMDFGGWITLSVTLGIGVVTLLIVKIWQTCQYLRTFKKLGIPGPRPLPIVGNMLPSLREQFKDVFQRWNEEFGKVYGVFFPNPAVVVGDVELARDVLVKKFAVFTDRNDFPGFSTDAALKDNLLSLKGDHWKHVRSQLSPTFSSNKLKKIFPAIERVAVNLCQRLENIAKSREQIELRAFCKYITVDLIAGVAFGLQVDSLNDPNDQFLKHADSMVTSSQKLLALIFTLPFLEKVLSLFGITSFPKSDTSYLLNVIDAALKERRTDKQKHGDFLQLLVEAEKAGSAQGQVDAEIDFRQQLRTSAHWTRKGLTQTEMRANSLIFLFAGYDTVSMVLSMTLFSLAANEECLRKAREEVDTKIGKGTPDYESAMSLNYVDMCMNEAMRLHLPGFVDRKAGEDMDIGGYHVSKDMRVIIPSAIFHTDPDMWQDPMKFDPERFTPEARATRHPFAFMPFGLGPRNCIGMRLAQLEIRMIIASILQKYTPVLCEKSVYPPVMKPFSSYTRDGLWVRFRPRQDVL